jgi:tRNA(Ile)-lysidine synthase
MVLLTAASRLPARARRGITVATFDHGTGKAAGRAAALVARHAFELGFTCIAGRASTIGTREEEWRRSRWAFLRQVARTPGAQVVTAHTRDDQIETVFMRILRDAGPRGLAGLYAESEIIRPFLEMSRASLAEYAHLHCVPFVQDPSNTDRKHLRNRIRLDILPSIVERNPAGVGAQVSRLASLPGGSRGGGRGRARAGWRTSCESIEPQRVRRRLPAGSVAGDRSKSKRSDGSQRNSSCRGVYY